MSQTSCLIFFEDLPTYRPTYRQTYISSPICFVATPKHKKTNKKKQVRVRLSRATLEFQVFLKFQWTPMFWVQQILGKQIFWPPKDFGTIKILPFLPFPRHPFYNLQTLSLCPVGTNQRPSRNPPDTLQVTSRHPLETLQTPSRHLPDNLQTPFKHPPDAFKTPTRHPPNFRILASIS